MDSKGLPDVTFLVNYSGITVLTRRLNTPRFVPFDRIKGRCDECKSNMLEIDYAVQNEGVTIITSRMKQPKFVQFDIIEPMPGNACFFRVKFQGKNFDVPFIQQQQTQPTTSLDSGHSVVDAKKEGHPQQETNQPSQVEQMAVN